jgi:hypothetical protein
MPLKLWLNGHICCYSSINSTARASALVGTTLVRDCVDRIRHLSVKDAARTVPVKYVPNLVAHYIG